ncbi:MAG: hypothetical protein WA637_00120 [Terriglobales bacterium]
MTLFRKVEVTKEDKTKLIGDWMIALETGHRIVLYFYERGGEQIVEMIYDKHMMEHGEHSAVPPPEIPGYVFCNIEDPREVEKYLRWYGAFPKA